MLPLCNKEREMRLYVHIYLILEKKYRRDKS